MALLLAPLTVLILLSQNSVPGDFLYPYKRGLENTILAAASVSPATRVAFRTDLTERRFDEAEVLLLANQDIRGVREFVSEITTTHEELQAIDNLNEKKNLQLEFNISVDKYNERLKGIQAKLDTQGQSVPIALASNTSQPISSPEVQPTNVPTNTPVPVPTATPFPTTTPVPRSTNTPVPLPATPTPTPEPTPTPVYTRFPHVHPLHSLGINLAAYTDCLKIPDIEASECYHHLQDDIRPPTGGSPPAPTPTYTPAPTLVPSATPTPTPDEGRGRHGGPGFIIIPSETPIASASSTTTPAAATCIPWDSNSCAEPGQAQGTNFGGSTYCGWSSSAWESCNARYHQVEGASDVKSSVRSSDNNFFENFIEWFKNL